MRRQTLFLLPALLGALAASFAVGYLPLRARMALAASAQWRPAQAQGLTLRLPADAKAPVQDPGDPWTATEFHTGSMGTLRIARERPRGGLQAALRGWFELPGPLDRPITYRVHGQPAQARPVTAFGPSGHFLRRQGRMAAAVCVFDLDGFRYWVQARIPDPSPAALACFDRVLLSLRGPSGDAVDPRLALDLQAAEAGLAPGICPNFAWAALMPVVLMIGLGGISIVISRRSGRAPETTGAAGVRYAEAPVELRLATRLQLKYFEAAIAVLEDRLVVYTFGTPFLELPLAGLGGRVAEGSGWFGPPYLELTLEGALDFRKLRRWAGPWTARTRLRIYTADSLRLRVALGV